MHKISKKKFLLILIVMVFVWKNWLHNFLWQQMFADAKIADDDKNYVFAERISPINSSVAEIMEFNGEQVSIKKLAEYEVIGRAVYVDIYDTGIYFGKKSEQVKLNKFYNKIAPLDISLFIGKTAAEDNWQKIKVEHEYRTVLWSYSYADKPVANNSEISNNHIIPANNNIRRSFDLIKKGEPIYMKGYLVDWHGMDKYADIDFASATKPGEYAEFLIGGTPSLLCRQFYVTKVIYNSYVYE